MTIELRQAKLEDVAFLADVVIRATLAQERFPPDLNMVEYRAGYEDWTRETILGVIPDCTLSVIEYNGNPVGRLRVMRTPTSITLAGIQLLPKYQNQRIGSILIEQLKHEADLQQTPLLLSVEKDNPNAQRLYKRLGFRTIEEDEQEYHLEYSLVIDEQLSEK